MSVHSIPRHRADTSRRGTALLLIGIGLLGCARRGGADADPPRSAQSPSMSEAPRGGNAGRKSSEQGLAEPNTACLGEGRRACFEHGSKLTLECKGDLWRIGPVCNDDERCDSQVGDSQGTCRPIAKQCKRQQPGRPFCAGDALRSCADLVSFEDEACGHGATCSESLGVAACECKAGYTGPADACIDVDECETNGGGCDASAPCQNTDGSYTCGGCPAGYVGGAGGKCVPTLTRLLAGQGMLQPEFSTVETEYTLQIPITSTTITLLPSAPASASIEIAGQVVGPEEAWRSSTIALGESVIELVVKEAKHPERHYKLHVQRGRDEHQYLTASNAGASDNFGTSLSVAADTLVVGAPGEDSNARGVDAAGTNDAALSAGAAYVFTHGDEGWTQQAYLKADNTAAGAAFGTAVAIFENTIAVGAPAEASGATDSTTAAYSGAVYLFTRKRGKWSQLARLKASNAGAGDRFGSALALSDDTLVVGAPGEASNGSGADGAQDNNAAPGSGAVYVFERGEDGWAQRAYLKPEHGGSNDAFGCSVALSGSTIIIGASAEDGGDTGIDADAQSEAAENSGAAYAFVREKDGWVQDAYFKGEHSMAGDWFGYSVAIAGNVAAIGAPGSSQGNGAVYLFERLGGVWRSLAQPSVPLAPAAARTGPGDAFGASVKLFGEVLLVGAYGDDSDGSGFGAPRGSDNAPNSGAAYMLYRGDEDWIASDFIKPTTTRANQQFGSRMTISADTIAIGAMTDGRDLRASVASQPMLGPPNSGAVYVFR